MSKEVNYTSIVEAGRAYRPFNDARAFVHNLGFNTIREYKRWAKSNERPQDIPGSPKKQYNGSWNGWADWLGTSFMSCDDATAKAGLGGGVNTQEKLRAMAQSGVVLQSIPKEQDDCVGHKDYIDPSNSLRDDSQYLSFVYARRYARSLDLKSQKEWREFSKSGHRPGNIPSTPDRTYADTGWISWRDWLGYDFLPFIEAQGFVHALHLRSFHEWRAFTKSGQRPREIPCNPNEIYAGEGWVNWRDWLGNEFLSFSEAREFARSLDLNSREEWQAFAKSGQRPREIPSDPAKVYAGDGWMNYSDWLGYEFLPFAEARRYARSLGLKSWMEWFAFTKSGKLPKDIPSNPRQQYAGKGWKSWRNWLGYDFLPFYEARNFARSLGLKSSIEWEAFAKSGQRPREIPASPKQVYAGKGWRGMEDWLGYVLIKGRPYRTECEDDGVPGSVDKTMKSLEATEVFR